MKFRKPEANTKVRGHKWIQRLLMNPKTKSKKKQKCSHRTKVSKQNPIQFILKVLKRWELPLYAIRHVANG